VILIKNLYLSKQYGAQRLLRKLPDKGWKLWSIDSLPKRSHKTGTIIPLPGSVRPRLSRSSEKPCAQSGKQAKKASVSSLDFAWNCSSVHRKIIHCDLQLTCFKCCRAQLLSEANRISRLTHWQTTLSSAINLVIVLLQTVSCIISKQNNMVTILQLIS